MGLRGATTIIKSVAEDVDVTVVADFKYFTCSLRRNRLSKQHGTGRIRSVVFVTKWLKSLETSAVFVVTVFSVTLCFTVFIGYLPSACTC